MKITIYKLLEMINEDKAPKTIKSKEHYYYYNELEKDYYEGNCYDYEYLLANTSVKGLDDEIEIIEYTPKKIPEKIEEKEIEVSMAIGEQICANKINEIIDYLNERITEYNNANKESKLNINKFHYQNLLYDLSKIIASSNEELKEGK